MYVQAVVFIHQCYLYDSYNPSVTMNEEVTQLRRHLDQARARNLTLERRLEAQEREIIYLRGGLSTAHFRLGQLLFGAPGRVSLAGIFLSSILIPLSLPVLSKRNIPGPLQ